MYRLAIILSVLLSAHSAYAGDARLDKPVTLAIKGAALSDIMPIIEKQTGARLKVAHDIADQKATIFVDDKPLKEIMTGLQTVFQYAWSYTDFKGKRSYSLSMPGKLRREREGWEKKAVDKAWQEFETEMKRLADVPVKSTEELDEILKQADSYEPYSRESNRAISVAGAYDRERRNRSVARLYRTFSPDLRKALRDGMTICYDLDSPEPEWKIPGELDAEYRRNLVVFHGIGLTGAGKKWETRGEYDSIGVEMRALVAAGNFSVEVYERHGQCPSIGGATLFRVYQKPLVKLAPLAKIALPRKDDPILDGKVSYTAKELEEEASLRKPLETRSQGTYVNRSDLLAILHEKLGLQIISDHYSHWYRWDAADKLPLRGILESFERFPGASQEQTGSLVKPLEDWYAIMLTKEYPAAEWGWDGKLLYMRAANPSTMDAREISNRLIHGWQAVSKVGSLGLTEVAEIHTLTKEQWAALTENYRWVGIELGQNQYSFDSVHPPLRLYGLLSPSQRQLMLDGRLSTRAFNAEQQSALLDLVSGTISSKLDQRKGCRVGVYDDAGRRVDKPDPGSSAYPESVRLEVKQQIEGFGIGDRPVAKTLEETMKAVHTESERKALTKFLAVYYEMTLTYADGTESKKEFAILNYAPVQLPAAPEKSEGTAKELIP